MYLAIHVLMAYSSLVGQEHSSKNKRSISLKTLLLFSRLICSKFVGLISDSQQVQIARILTDTWIPCHSESTGYSVHRIFPKRLYPQTGYPVDSVCRIPRMCDTEKVQVSAVSEVSMYHPACTILEMDSSSRG